MKLMGRRSACHVVARSVSLIIIFISQVLHACLILDTYHAHQLTPASALNIRRIQLLMKVAMFWQNGEKRGGNRRTWIRWMSVHMYNKWRQCRYPPYTIRTSMYCRHGTFDVIYVIGNAIQYSATLVNLKI